MQDWDTEKNDLRPWEISRASGKEVAWSCQVCGHKWETPLYQRTHGMTNCPECHRRESSQKVIDGLTRAKKRRQEVDQAVLDSLRPAS